MSLESSKALKKLVVSIRTMTMTSSADIHIANSKAALKSLKSLLQSNLWKETDLFSLVQPVTVASLLIDIVECTEEIADSVNVLASIVDFDVEDADEKSPKTSQSPNSECAKNDNNPHVVILIEEPVLSDCGKTTSDQHK